MPNWVTQMYIEQLDTILAAEERRDIEVSSFPHLPKEDQRKIQNRLTAAMAPLTRMREKIEAEIPKEPMTEDQFKANIASLGIPLIFEDAKPEEVSADA